MEELTASTMVELVTSINNLSDYDYKNVDHIFNDISKKNPNERKKCEELLVMIKTYCNSPAFISMYYLNEVF